MSRVAIGTIVAKNYLPFARVLVRSVREWHPGIDVFALVVDEPNGCFDPASEDFPILGLDEILPDAHRLRFGLTARQLISAAKPFLLEALLDRGFSRALYLDADILVLDSLGPLLQGRAGASLVLTPHMLEPLEGPDRAARELEVLRAGVYNAGCIAANDTPEARRVLAWWQRRVCFRCDEDLASGVHYDQRWLDFLPTFAADLEIVRDPGCNVGWWNVSERGAMCHDERLTVGGGPCRFFHFSGFDPETPDVLSRHVPASQRAALADLGWLFRRYAGLLEEAGSQSARRWPYTWDRFRGGIPIPDLAREIYLVRGEAVYGDPFETGAGTFVEWLRGPDERAPLGSSPLPRLWREVWEQREDVRRAFPDSTGRDRDAFLTWARDFGAREYGIPVELLPG